jgi:chemotaxis protein methyltransferase WspC
MAKAAPENPPVPISLAAARELADNGKLDEAVQICLAHLAEHGASVEAYYLLGVIHDAQGHPDARDFYRKALYLNPNHYECLLQMALLAEKDGDPESARNLRRRAQRIQIQE